LSADLRKLADIVESHPEHAEIWRSMMNRLTDFSYSRDEFVAWVRDMTGQLTSEKCGPSRGLKKQYFDQYAVATGYIGFIELTLHTQRDLVCERVVKGYETKLVPDPDAPKVEKRVEIVEWLCNPLLVNAQEGE
jgi:hypothetical protein